MTSELIVAAFIKGYVTALNTAFTPEQLFDLDEWQVFDDCDINFYGEEYSGKEGISVAVYELNHKDGYNDSTIIFKQFFSFEVEYE